MKKLVLLSMATVLALGVTARVMNVEKAYQKPIANMPAPVMIDHSITPDKNKVVIPMKMEASKAGQLISLKADASATTPAWYSRTLGQFYCGYSIDFYGYGGNFMQYCPAFSEATFTAYTQEGATFNWTYYTGMADSTAVDGGSDTTLVQQLQNEYIFAPELTANDSTYSWSYIKPGGACFTHPSTGRTYLACQSDHSWDGAYYTSQFETNVTDMSEIYSDVPEGEATLKGYAEFVGFQKPYVLNAVHFIASCEEAGGTVNLKIVRANTDDKGMYTGFTDDVLTTAESTVDPVSGDYTFISFENLTMPDPVSGLDVPLVIDGPIMVIVTSEEAQINPTFFLSNENIATEKNAFITFNWNDEEYMGNANYRWGSKEPYSYNSAWNFQYDIEFNYIHGEDEEVVIAPEGGEAVIEVQSQYGYGAWTVETVDGEDVPEWLTISMENQYDEETDETTGETSRAFNGGVTITFAAEALPEGTTSREADIKFYYDGAEYIVHVKQGESGPEPDPYAPGDVNMDGNVNAGDVSAVYGVILGTETNEEIIKRADLNNDGNVNAGDISDLYAIILSASSN